MIKLKTITDKYRSVYAAAKALNVNSTQLGRWLAKDAYIDDEGSPYIKTKGVLIWTTTNKESTTKSA